LQKPSTKTRIETIRNPLRGFRYLPRLIRELKKALHQFLRSKNNPFLVKLLSLERRFIETSNLLEKVWSKKLFIW
jgi:hypothetical protein